MIKLIYLLVFVMTFYSCNKEQNFSLHSIQNSEKDYIIKTIGEMKPVNNIAKNSFEENHEQFLLFLDGRCSSAAIKIEKWDQLWRQKYSGEYPNLSIILQGGIDPYIKTILEDKDIIKSPVYVIYFNNQFIQNELVFHKTNQGNIFLISL